MEKSRAVTDPAEQLERSEAMERMKRLEGSLIWTA
jgi:hypothetical protein